MRITKNPDERRAEIIAAARELFDKNGIKKTQVSQIVKRVGVAQGLFYYYFSSKDEVVNVVMQTVLEEIKQAAEAILHHPTGSFCRKLSQFIELYLKLIDQFSGDNEENLRDMLESISQNDLAKQAQQLMIEHLEKLVNQGVSNGDILVGYPVETAKVLFYGLLMLSKERLIGSKQLCTMVEQGLHLPDGSLKLHTTGSNQ